MPNVPLTIRAKILNDVGANLFQALNSSWMAKPVSPELVQAQRTFGRILGLFSPPSISSMVPDEPPRPPPAPEMQRPTWLRPDDWDDDMPDLSLDVVRDVLKKDKDKAKKQLVQDGQLLEL